MVFLPKTKILNQFKSYDGFASTVNNAIISTSFKQFHEPVHLISEKAGFKFSNIIFNEGLAVALGGTTSFTVNRVNKKAKEIVNSLDYIPLQELFLFNYSKFMNNANITYYEMGSFVDFLIKEFGMEKFLSICSEDITNLNRIESTLIKKYNYDVHELENKWTNYLNKSY